LAVPDICPLGEGVVIEIDRLVWMPSWMSVTAGTGMIHGRPAKGAPRRRVQSWSRSATVL